MNPSDEPIWTAYKAVPDFPVTDFDLFFLRSCGIVWS